MLNVVLTGPAIDGEGNSILRANLVKACNAEGTINIQSKVDRHTDVLVASRLDTVKALAAHSRGVLILTYPEFVNRHLGGVVVAKEGKPNGYSHKVVRDLLVPDFTSVFTEAELL